MPRTSCSFDMCAHAVHRYFRTTWCQVIRWFAIIVLVAAAGGSANAASVEGLWIDDTGQGAIEISRCGRGLCGHIVWLRNPTDARGQPIVDALNPSPRRREQAVCGLQVMGQLQPQPNGTWDQGWIYDPKQGKSFDVMLSLRSPNQLVVTGYLGVKFLSETFVWRRAPRPLPRCTS